MGENSFMFDNKREQKIYKLYLNPRCSDVNFVFDADTDHPEKIPAHKVILALDSPVFENMFFCSMQEKGDIKIVDAPAAAFKEFLQFFYLNEVRLSSTNIIYVTNLCKKYEMDGSLEQCEKIFIESLAIDDICSRYGIAQLLGLENAVEFCEEKIKMNPVKIMKSESFLESDKKLLSKILAMVSPNWNALEVVIACMEWSKSQCKHSNLDVSTTNLRSQLDDVFSQIPFEKLTTEQITQHVALYRGFFTAEELETFLQTSMPKLPNPFDIQQLPVIPPMELLECDREGRLGGKHSKLCSRLDSATVFTSNVTLLLSKFSLYNVGSEFDYNVHEGPENIRFDKLILKGYSSTSDIMLPQKIVINAGKFYRIGVSCRKINGFQNMINDLRSGIEMAYGIRLRFNSKYEDKITKLYFITPDR